MRGRLVQWGSDGWPKRSPTCPPEWLVLHDRLLFPGRSESNLDHVLVGPAGVVLIDAKNWSGNLSEWEGGLFKHQHGPNGHAAMYRYTARWTT